MQSLRLVLILAVRSLLAHRAKSLIIGSLLFVGTFVVVLGNALLDSIEEAMRTTLTHSLAGDFQLQSKDAEDPLALFGGGGFGTSDIGEIPHFEQVEAEIGKLDGVRFLVPMGVTNATVFGRNEIDRVLTELRDALRDGDTEQVPRLVARARRIVADLSKALDTAKAIADEDTYRKNSEALLAVSEDTFWTAFEPGGDALPALDFLDSRVAPLASDGDLYYLRVFGTDPVRFVEAFPRFEIIEGQMIPPGRPGFLFNHRTYEKLIKNRVARELDALVDEADDGNTIAADPLLQQRVRRLADQYRLITFQLEPEDATALTAELKALLGRDGTLEELVQAFLKVDDASLRERTAWFYEHIGPRVALHVPKVGDSVTLRGFTQSGYLRAVEVPVWGTYDFEGLEDADISGASNLVDLVTFRELYGKMSDSAREELAGIREEVGVKAVSREDAEAALFGGGADVEVAVADQGALDVNIASVNVVGPFERTFPAEETRTGLVLDAAIVLEDPDRSAALRPELERVADGLGLKVLDWKEASGTLGQMITVLRITLLTAVAIIFLVALIIVNNAMVMATMDRVPEIGTLRAIGTQRTTVLGLFLVETGVLGLVAGGVGGLAAVGVIVWLHSVGIPAPADELVLLFGGPRLFPTIGLNDIVFGLITITTVAVASTLYPATLAARVPPIVAMRGRE